MTTTIKTRLVKIGNSQGIRIPKLLLEQVGFGGEIQVEVESDHLVLRPVRLPRQSWEEHYKRMAVLGEDQLLDADVLALTPTQWETEEWQW